MIAVVDTGPLYAVTDTADGDHVRAVEVLHNPEFQIVIPALVVAEVTYLVGTRLGPRAESRFLQGVEQLEVEAPAADEWRRIAEYVEKYHDFPLGGTDASVIVLAERLETDVILTLDRRHFSAIRPRHTTAFRLLPE